MLKDPRRQESLLLSCFSVALFSCNVVFQTGQQARFDFHGNVIPADVDIPVSEGLHHHGDEPQVSGGKLELSPVLGVSQTWHCTFCFNCALKHKVIVNTSV